MRVVNPDLDNHNNQIDKSLKLSVSEGVYASVMAGFTQDFFTPFVLLMGGAAQHVGILTALPSLIASTIQLKAAQLPEKVGSRKKIFTFFVFLQALSLIPLILIGITGKKCLPGVILAVTVFVSCGVLSTPAWASMMSELVNRKKWGEFFGWRNRILGFVIVTASFLASFILTMMKRVSVFQGFTVLFSVAFGARLVSWHLLRRMYDPPVEYKKELTFSFLDLVTRKKEPDFAQFVLFGALFKFSVALAAPFFSVLMLKDLHFNYVLYTTITVTEVLTGYLLIKRWGKLADHVGNLKIIRLTAPLIGLVPFLWMVNRTPVYLFFVQILSGLAWSGYNISISNFIYDSVTRQNRTRCISFFNFFDGYALCIGAFIGGFIAHKLPPCFGFHILTLFLISSVLRLVVGIVLPGKLKEVRSVAKLNNGQVFLRLFGIKGLNFLD